MKSEGRKSKERHVSLWMKGKVLAQHTPQVADLIGDGQRIEHNRTNVA